eukprot:scaffold3095_cov106-Skeletonema_dohrnii-CCMP3373.AAC.1
MAQWQGGFPYQSMTAAMHPGAAVEGMAQWLGGYPVQPMAAGPVPPSHMAKQMGLVVAQTEWIREQALVHVESIDLKEILEKDWRKEVDTSLITYVPIALLALSRILSTSSSLLPRTLPPHYLLFTYYHYVNKAFNSDFQQLCKLTRPDDVTANNMKTLAVGNAATDPDRSALNDAIGRCADDNHVGPVNNDNVAGANTSVNTLTNDVKSIARFLVVNEADCDMRFNALETIMGEVMKALEENKSEITALKAKITELEAQMQIND